MLSSVRADADTAVHMPCPPSGLEGLTMGGWSLSMGFVYRSWPGPCIFLFSVSDT